jgi:hypothetical protein
MASVTWSRYSAPQLSRDISAGSDVRLDKAVVPAASVKENTYILVITLCSYICVSLFPQVSIIFLLKIEVGECLLSFGAGSSVFQFAIQKIQRLRCTEL